MKGLLKPLALAPNRQADKRWDGKTYKLLKELVYATKAGLIISVPVGFLTDLASWIRPSGRYIEAAVIHDFLYSIKAGRPYADRIFKEAMARGGCPRWRIFAFYYAVRCFGWWSYYISPLLKRT